jgi:hypothetical protein
MWGAAPDGSARPSPRFEVDELSSITPSYNRGALRYLNSARARRAAEGMRLGVVMQALTKLQERAWLGWTLMALAT